MGEGANRPTYFTGPPPQQFEIARAEARLTIVVLTITVLFLGTLATLLRL